MLEDGNFYTSDTARKCRPIRTRKKMVRWPRKRKRTKYGKHTTMRVID